MKKLTALIGFIVVFLVGSCKKERNCVCTTTLGTVVTNTIKATKKKAKNKCEAQSETVGNVEKTCKIQD